MASPAEKPQDPSKVEAQGNVVDTTTANVDRPASAVDELEYVPDGGKEAWTVVLGSTLALFASAGMINAYVGRSPCVCRLTLANAVLCREHSRTIMSRHSSRLRHLHR